MKHISRQLGVRWLRETDTCSPPCPSRARTWRIKDSNGLVNAPLFPIYSVEPNTPSRIRYSVGLLHIELTPHFVSFTLSQLLEGAPSQEHRHEALLSSYLPSRA